MNDYNEDNLLRQRYGETLAELDRLAEAIDRKEYPGLAWPARSRPVRRIIWPALAACAAAVLIAAGLTWLLPDPAGPVAPAGLEKTAASAPAEKEKDKKIVWSVPAGFNVSLAGSISLELPSISMSPGDGGGIEWAVPTIEFPSHEERSINNESSKLDSHPSYCRSGYRPPGNLFARATGAGTGTGQATPRRPGAAA